MLKVSQLLKFVSDLNPQNTPTRLCFYNFLKGFADPEAELSQSLLDLFFDHTLDYPHWVSNKNQLGHEVQYLMDNFNSFYQQKFDLSDLRFPQNRQIIELENQADAEEVIRCYISGLCGPEDKFRLINDANKRFVAILLRSDRSLEVRTFDRKFTIRSGMLEPLRRDMALYYTPELELSPKHIQQVEVAPYITARFRVQSDRVYGALLRGYVFQKLLELKGEPLKEQTRLLFPIKRLEQYFVDRRTDPYYQELLSQLERTRALIQQGDIEALKWCSMILSQAETALEHVFAGDKMLELLVRDLRHTAESNRQSVSINKGNEECLKISPIGITPKPNPQTQSKLRSLITNPQSSAMNPQSGTNPQDLKILGAEFDSIN